MSCFYLVGAGPGDPGLITVAGKECLQNAEVVLYDRLVSEEILALVPKDVTKIYVGKSQNEQEMKQAEIYTIALEHLGQNKKVVRLKGGDPFVFGRGVEEFSHIASKGYEVRYIPGVSSAIAVPGLAQIPVTARGVSRGFAVISGHLCGTEKLDLTQYAKVDTIVILMGVKHRREIANELITLGRDPNEGVAFVENGSISNERTVRSTLDKVAKGEVAVNSPAVFVIGNVVDLIRT